MVLDRGLVIALADDLKVALKGFGEFWRELYLVLGQGPSIEEVEDDKQKDGLVRALVGAAFVAPEVVKALQPLLPCLLGRHWVAKTIQVRGTGISWACCGSERKGGGGFFLARGSLRA